MPKVTIDHDSNPIEGARKDIDFFTGTTYSADNEAHVSEWAVAVGLRQFQDRQTVEEEDVNEAIGLAKVQQTVDLLIDRGMMTSCWDPDQGAVVYNVTEKGIKEVEDAN